MSPAYNMAPRVSVAENTDERRACAGTRNGFLAFPSALKWNFSPSILITLKGYSFEKHSNRYNNNSIQFIRTVTINFCLEQILKL